MEEIFRLFEIGIVYTTNKNWTYPSKRNDWFLDLTSTHFEQGFIWIPWQQLLVSEIHADLEQLSSGSPIIQFSWISNIAECIQKMQSKYTLKPITKVLRHNKSLPWAIEMYRITYHSNKSLGSSPAWLVALGGVVRSWTCSQSRSRVSGIAAKWHGEFRCDAWQI